MNRNVTVVDYGSNNLYSIVHALEVNGAGVKVAKTAEEIRSSERLVLPGVGAFPECKLNLVESGVFDELILWAGKERPLLGICLGMQMLATKSFEFGVTSGLDLIPGNVEPIPNKRVDGFRLKRPHIGWAMTYQIQEFSSKKGILNGVPRGSEFYMVHSFHVVPNKKAHLIAITDYGGHEITAVVQNGNVIGCQFHPEKSGVNGMIVLNNFLNI